MTWTAALPHGVRFHGGPACLDFANTTEQLRSAQPRDWLTGYDVLLGWSAARGTLSGSTCERLLIAADKTRAVADAVFGTALTLRRSIRDFAAAAMNGSSLDEAIRGLDEVVRSQPPQPALTFEAERGPGTFAFRGDDLAEPLWPVVWSFTALVTSGDASRIRCCSGDGCGYVYVDTTLNQSRRYCSNAGCGNRTRVRRHYNRLQARDIKAAPVQAG